jgi:3-methyl-2-oxobutanoate hydroxymethyltransferase
MTMKKITVPDFRNMKTEGRKIAVLTAYDFLMARLLDMAGVDAVLVGDSVGMVFSGFETTLPVTLRDMIYHGRAVRRAVKRSLLIIDMPFMSYQVSAGHALHNCGKVMKETGANAVKIEGGEEVCEVVRSCMRASIPVMGHIGLTPQSIHRIGGYKVQGQKAGEGTKLLHDALCLQEAGCFSIVLEMVAAEVAEEITSKIGIPTIGIGSGAACDGQVLVIYDMLGMNEEFKARFFKTYVDLSDTIRGAVRAYVEEVKAGKFPADEHSFHSDER